MTTNAEMMTAVREQLKHLVEQFGDTGLRVLGVTPEGKMSDAFLNDDGATVAVLLTLPIYVPPTPSPNPSGGSANVPTCPHCGKAIQIRAA